LQIQIKMKKVIKLTESQLEVIKKRVQEQDEEVTNDSSKIETMASHLLFSQTQVHIFHLQTDSYAEHKALQGYYEGIDGLADSLIESYQGENDIIQNYTSFPMKKYEGKEMVINYFNELLKMIEENREGLPSHLQNIVDTIVELITSTLYKLKRLK